MPTSNWSTNPAENTSVGGVFIGENCPPGNLNNGERTIMAEAKAKFDAIDTAVAAIDVTMDPTLKAIGDLVTSADKLAYFTGVDAAALTALTPFARTLLDDADASAVAATIGAVRVISSSLTDPGYLKLAIGAGSFLIQWGSAAFPQDAYKVINYPAPFSSFSIPVMSGHGENGSGSAQDNGPAPVSAGAASFNTWNASRACTAWWIAVGV